jgi:hypothetical protein
MAHAHADKSEIRNKFKIRIFKCSKHLLEHEYRDLNVLVIRILRIRICFVLRASDFVFGFERALCSMPYAYVLPNILSTSPMVSFHQSGRPCGHVEQ